MPIQWNSFGISPIHTWPHLPDFLYQQRKPRSSNSPSKERFRRNPRPPNRQSLSQPPDLPIQQQPTWPPMAAGHSDRQPGQRRPMCGVCTKPLRVCLCGRLRAPPLDTNVGVTVLQHSMEAQHPLSSIRVARLGLRNLVVTQVTDVNHRACFLLRTLDGEDTDEINNEVFCNLSGKVGRVEGGSDGDECFRREKMKCDEHHRGFERPISAMNQPGNFVVNAINDEDQHISETEGTHKVNGDLPHPAIENTSEFHFAAVGDSNGVCSENFEFSTAIGQGWIVKNMDKCSVAYTEKELRIDIERGVKPKIRWLSRGLLGQVAVSNGFVVTKIQKKKLKLTGEVSEFEEFSITIPPHSALLFPCQRAVSIDASDCKVEHLIVLDGTWAKAQRMYHENPWLQLLPHVKLESDRVSLYCEVRHEPRAGCLSTIESIVVAMKKLGEDAKGLDDVLDVFESMIADQRRCKDENCEQKLKSQP